MGFLQDGMTLLTKMNDVLGRVVKSKMGSLGVRAREGGGRLWRISTIMQRRETELSAEATKCEW